MSEKERPVGSSSAAQRRADIAEEQRESILAQLGERLDDAAVVAALGAILDGLGPRGAHAPAHTLDIARNLVASVDEKAYEQVLTASTEVSQAAEQAFDELHERRDQIVLSLALYDDERGLAAQTGLSRQRVHEMKCDALMLSEAERNRGASCSKDKISRRFCGCEGHWLNNATPAQVASRARRAGIKRIAPGHGRKALPELSELTLQAEERKKAALLLRNFLVAATDPVVWPRERLAELIDKNVSQITRIRARMAAHAVGVGSAA